MYVTTNHYTRISGTTRLEHMERLQKAFGITYRTHTIYGDTYQILEAERFE